MRSFLIFFVFAFSTLQRISSEPTFDRNYGGSRHSSSGQRGQVPMGSGQRPMPMDGRQGCSCTDCPCNNRNGNTNPNGGYGDQCGGGVPGLPLFLHQLRTREAENERTEIADPCEDEDADEFCQCDFRKRINLCNEISMSRKLKENIKLLYRCAQIEM